MLPSDVQDGVVVTVAMVFSRTSLHLDVGLTHVLLGYRPSTSIWHFSALLLVVDDPILQPSDDVVLSCAIAIKLI